MVPKPPNPNNNKVVMAFCQSYHEVATLFHLLSWLGAVDNNFNDDTATDGSQSDITNLRLEY